MKRVNDIFGKELKVLNIGLEQFCQDLKDQNVISVQMDWRPPAGGDSEAADLLAALLG
ncbi:fdrA domain protein [Lutispora saccharofermentans]|uniref:FdrA domain protein n=1 Tax=Lutispora saccharofermentans TaxID=3024236 RepID=A0ABT1ND10_9FIRM|nr:fdrA domain protein [Lutispora saccharofermentans]MCQ1529115.1 fdrA domain protein [Lutispora saccharofermentans]